MTKSERESNPRSPRSINVEADSGLILDVNNIQDRRLRNVLSVSIKNIRTVHQLKRAIATRHNLSVQELLYRGTRLGDDRQLAHLLPTMMKVGNSPRFSVRTRLGTSSNVRDSVSLVVRSLQGVSFMVHLPPKSSIADVENAIRDHEGYSPKQHFQMICGGKHLLPDSFSLPVSGSTVHVVGRLPGGYANRTQSQSFVDMQNMSSLKIINKETRSGPNLSEPWRNINYGLNIRGKCQNVECAAHDCDVWCRKGFTVFNIAEPVNCPSCEKSFTAATCGFWGCEWMFEGRKKESGVDMMSKWNVATKKEFQKFDDAEGQNTADWSSLIITAVRLDGTGQESIEHVCEITCALCFGSIDAPSARTTDTTCSHAVHPECARHYLLAGYDTCPTCRLPLSQGGTMLKLEDWEL